ncbi:MAG: pyridoxamine 5'-phosphate oxidase family protein [Candidatus Heimdallarchaeota archaeon]
MVDKKLRDRPDILNYGIETSKEGLLKWEFVEEQMVSSHSYWLSTTNPNGNPHAIPVWGIWYGAKLYFGGGPKTRYRKNLEVNPNIVAHAESGSKVVIIQGTAIVEENDDVTREIIKLYKEKYNIDHPPPFLRVDGKKILAWTMEDYTKTPTRWIITNK